MATGRLMSIETIETEINAKGPRSIKSNPDVENFYRFIQENNLRKEAHSMLREIVHFLKPPKKKRGRRKSH